MNFTFQPKRSEVWGGWACLLFWSILAAAFFIYMPAKIESEMRPGQEFHSTIFWTMFVGFFLFWILFSIYWILYALRFRLKITDEIVEKQGILRHRQIDLDRVTSAHWRLNSISLKTAAATVRVRFDNTLFSRTQTRELILFFRRRLPESIQNGWESFWEKMWTLFDQLEDRSPEELAATFRSYVRMMFFWTIIGFLILAVGDYFAWHYTGESKWLYQPLLAFGVPPAFWLLWKFHRKTKVGKIAKTRLKNKNELWWIALFLFSGYFVVPILAFLPRFLRWYGCNSWSEYAFILSLWLVFLSPMIWLIRKELPLRARWNREAAKTAAELYLKPPGGTDS